MPRGFYIISEQKFLVKFQKLVYRKGMANHPELHSIYSHTRNALLITGPDDPFKDINGTDEDSTHLANVQQGLSFFWMRHTAYMGLWSKMVEPEQLGDGLPDTVLDISEIKSAINRQPEGAIIFVLAHGSNHPKVGHFLTLSAKDKEDSLLTTSSFLDMVRDTGKRMNIAMISCHSGMMHEYAQKTLPTGSMFLTLADNEQIVSKVDAFHTLSIRSIESSIRTLAPKFTKNPDDYSTRGEFSFHKFLQNTLFILDEVGDFPAHTKGPRLTVAGMGTCRFSDLVKDHMGRPFTALERFYIEARTKDFDSIKDNATLRRIQDGSFDETSAPAEHKRAKAMLRNAMNGRVPLKPFATAALT